MDTKEVKTLDKSILALIFDHTKRAIKGRNKERFFERDEAVLAKARLAAGENRGTKINRLELKKRNRINTDRLKVSPWDNRQSDVRCHLHLEADASWAKGGTNIGQYRKAQARPTRLKEFITKRSYNGNLAA